MDENFDTAKALSLSALLMMVSGLLFGTCASWTIGALFIASGILLFISSSNFNAADESLQKSLGILETERLILRPWTEDDAEALYEYASDPRVGPVAGWQPHKSIEESREIIHTVFSAPETYAVVLKETGKPVGSIGLLFEGHSEVELRPGEVEIGYWIGVPYWGKGLIPEATCEILRHCFEDLGFEKVWAGYYNDNLKSKRVQEKCGFKYDHTERNHYCELMDEYRTVHLNCITKEEWKSNI